MDPEAVAPIKGCQLTRQLATSLFVKREGGWVVCSGSTLVSPLWCTDWLIHPRMGTAPPQHTDVKKRKVSGMNGRHHRYSGSQGCNQYSLSSCVIHSKCPSHSLIASAGLAGLPGSIAETIIPQRGRLFIRPKVKVWKWKSLSHVLLCNPMDCSPPGSSVWGILQAKILEWVAISFSWDAPLTQG